MPMSYQPKFPQLRERICVYGQNGVGKTNVAITMMRRMTDRHFHILDNNASYEFSIYEDDERNAKIIDAQSFTIHEANPHSWIDQKRIIEEIEDACVAGDWAVFDMLDPLWESIPGWYTKDFLGLDEDEYRAKVRLALEEKRDQQVGKGEKGDRTAPLFDQLRDYQHINPTYKKAVYGAMTRLNSKGVHVLCVAGAKLVGDKDDRGLRKIYAPGDRPGSQKGLTGEVNTVLNLEHDGEEEFTITTKKDRASRKAKRLDEDEWTDFCSVYLSPVARWSMQKVD